MKVKNVTLVITDPCYIMKEEKIDYSTCPNRRDYHKYESEKDYPDYVKRQGSKTYHEEEDKYDEAYKKWHEENQRDWDKCDCGYEFSVHYGDGYYDVPYEKQTKHCPDCGQALDWD